MAVYCENCRKQNNWPKPAVRTTTDPCDVCGSYDAIRIRKFHPVTGEAIVKTEKMKNFEHFDIMLPGTAQETKVQAGIDGSSPTATTGR